MAKKPTQLVHVRMPKDLHRKLMRDAERLGQTLNAVILLRLEAADQYQALVTSRNRAGPELKDTAEDLKRVAAKFENTESELRKSIDHFRMGFLAAYAEGLDRSERDVFIETVLKGIAGTNLQIPPKRDEAPKLPKSEKSKDKAND